MDNLIQTEQSRLENKTQALANDLRVKFPDPTSSKPKPLALTTKEFSLSDIEKPKIEFQPEVVDPSSLYATLPSGERIQKFDSYVTGSNEEERAAQLQTTSNKWTNGITKFFGKTGSSILGGTAGSIYGIFDAVKSGSIEAVWNNDFTNYLDDLNTKLDYKLPNYYTEQEKEAGFIDSAQTANFWANDFLGGLSFTVGTIVSEAGWAAATGGTSLIASGARYGLRAANSAGKVLRGIDNVKDIGKAVKDASKLTKDFIKKSALDTKTATNYGKALQALNTARFTYTSAGYEAGVEARQYIREQKENFERNFVQLYGRQPSEQERLDFNKNLESTANTVFASNLALVGGSNLAIIGKMYNISSPVKAPSKWVNKKLFGVGVQQTEKGTFESIKRTAAQRIAGTTYSIFKAPLIEGLVEEGGQAVTSTAAGAFLEAKYNNQKPAVDLIEAMYEGLSETYGTKEGWKEIGLGMLIGLVGGQASNVASGQGLFSDVSNLKKRDDLEAKARNLYSAEKVVAEITKSAVVNKANQESQKAAQRGDITGEALSDTMAMMANVMMAEEFGYSEDAKNDIFTIVDLISDETIQEQYGVSEEGEIQKVKQNIKDSYSKLQDSYKKNREFAEYSINANTLPDGTDIQTLKEGLAYQLTMAEKAEELTEDYLKAIKEEVLTFVSPNTDYTQALDLQDALLKTTPEKRREYSNLKRRYKRAQQALDLTEKQTRAIQNAILSREEAGNLAKQLNKYQQRTQDVQLEMDNINNEINVLTEGILLSSPFRESSDIVRSFDVIDIDESLTKLQQELTTVSKRDFAKAARLEKLTNEYRKALSISRNYGNIINGLLNPEVGLRGESRAFFLPKKSLNEVTYEFLNDLKKANEDYKVIQQRFEQTTSENKTQTPEKDDINKKETETTVEVKQTPIQTLRNKLNELLNSNEYLLNYFGEDLEAKQPTGQDVAEYQSLKNNYQGEDINILINVDPTRLSNSARGGLNLAEITRYQQLSRKLANWRLLDGVEEQGISILDIINQIESLQKPVNQELDINDNTTETEDLEIAFEAKQVDVQESSDPSLMQTWDTVLVKQNKTNTELTHLNLSSLVKLGASIKENGVPITNVEKVQKEIGRTFTIEINGKSIPTKVVAHNRLKFENNKFEELINSTGFKVIDMTNVKGSRWSTVYNQTEQGYKPLDTDYVINPNDSEFTSLSPEEVYNIEPDSNVYFKLNLNEEWNREYEAEIDALNINDTRAVEELKNKIQKQVLVYVTNENNEVAGVLKAANEKTVQPEFLAIRKKAADILFESYLNKGYNKTVHDLPFSTKVEKIFVGHPNLTFVEQENGKLKPQKTPLNERTIKMIESFGVANNGSIVQNPNTQIDTSLANTQFIQNLEGNRPVAIIRYKNQLIAYPITIQRRDSNLYDIVVDILSNPNITNTQKVVDIANVLRENGIDPTQYNLIQTGDISFIGSEEQNKLLNNIQNITKSIQPEEFLSASYTKDNLLVDASITVNLENRPFRNPKLKVDYDSIAPVVRAESFEEDLFYRTGRVMPSVVNGIVNKISQNNQENLSQFEKDVLNLYQDEINDKVEEKLTMSEENKNKSKNERKRKCPE